MQYTTKQSDEAPRLDEVIPARGHWAQEVKTGELLRIEDVDGQQAVDLICYDLQNLEEKFWAAHTAKVAKSIYVSTGDVLYSDLARPMMTIVEDTVGVNDVICGSCSYPLDVLRYGEEKAQRGCMENFEDAIRPWGLRRSDIPMCFNIFLRYLVEPDGAVSIDHEAPSRAGDQLTLRAERDLLVAISDCPQENNPCTGYNPSPLRVTITSSIEA